MSPRGAAAAAALVALMGGCGRTPPPPAPPAPAVAPRTVRSVPWTWHPLGDLAVIEGEVKGPTQLILEGPSVRATRFADRGPVRWELYRPPEGEVADLRTASGQALARFVFSTHPGPLPRPARPPVPRPVPAPPHPQPAPRPTPAPRPRPRTRVAPPPPTPRPHAPAAPRPAPARPAPTPAAPPRQPAAPLPAVRWPGMDQAFDLTRGPRGLKQILLSFDGGSSDEVAAQVLDILKAHGIHTTFFLTGAFIRRYPAIVRRMAAEGHEIGDHTMDHPHFAPGMKRDPAWTKARIQKELLDADAELVRLLGRPMDPYWRAPYGEQTPEIRRWAEEVGYRHVGWSEGADTLDWATVKERRLYHSGPAILQRLRRRMAHDGDGLIVLMHLGSERVEQDRPVDGLGAFIDRAQAEGWRFVNAGTFFRELGKPAWDPRQRLALIDAIHPRITVTAAR